MLTSHILQGLFMITIISVFDIVHCSFTTSDDNPAKIYYSTYIWYCYFSVYWKELWESYNYLEEIDV